MIDQRPSPEPPAGAPQWDGRRDVPLVCLGLVAITFLVFGQTLGHEFVNFDDGDYVYENPMVAQGFTWKGVAWAFTRVHSDNWHPLTWLSHMADCQIYGLNPAGHHLTNVLLHAAAVVALFLVLRQMTGALWRSAVVAAVFAIHPLRVESVAWVAERKDVLSGLFFMLTIAAYLRYVRCADHLKIHYALVVIVFAMGLLCKPMLVTLPLVLLLLDYWPLQRMGTGKLPGLLMEKLPLLALSAASCVATLLAERSALQSIEAVPLSLRLGNALMSCVVYLRQALWPARLAVFYPFQYSHLPAWELGAAALLAGLAAIAFGLRRRQPWLLMGLLWYWVMLLPVAGVLQVGDHAHADRYTYLPQIGIYLAATWLLAEWRMNRAAAAGLVTGVVGALALCAWKQTALWKNSETLWTHTLSCTTGNYVAHYNLGNVYLKQGRLQEAITQYHQTLQIKPAFAGAHHNLGAALLRLGRLDEAMSQFQKTLQIKPNHLDARVNLGNVLIQMGRLDAGISQYREALQIDPGYWKARFNLGNALAQKGDLADAIAQFQQALQSEPADTGVLNNLAWLLAAAPDASLRNGAKAVVLAEEANRLTGKTNAVMLRTLAAALAEAGRFPQAKDASRRALDLAKQTPNPNLAAQIQWEMDLYQAGSPFHLPAVPHSP
jgi:tetratricopeptide (TPR) repeat protein